MALDETVTLRMSNPHGGEAEVIDIPRRLGTVKLGEMLGEGTGGVVLTGFDTALNRRVAVKLLRRQDHAPTAAALAELVEGVRSAARIKHPNLVTVHTVLTVAEMPAIVMEFVDGQPLRTVMRAAPTMDQALAVHIFRSIARGVQALHEANVVHRDLKPANVLLDADGNVVVVDFGLACEMRDSADLGHVGTINGSPLYMAPEMFEGYIAPQSDVYALGVMLFEALVGEAPFHAETMDAMKTAQTAAPVPMHRLEDRALPEAMCDVVSRCLHKRRFLRYKTAGHLLRALDDLAEGSEDAHRQRLASIVSQTRGSDDVSAEDATPSGETMFDMVKRRAREKRMRGSDGEDSR